ncbi:MAG: transposase [Spirochaetes bacterium]|nr:MAG: transposase [Spirochaetota bacterium]RKX98139.1 MAG: transposase [Spirochaetota bacterium]
MAKIMDLFEAYSSSEMPRDGGFIITELLDDSSRYARYEVISYGNVKDIYLIDEGIMFQADGRKLFVLFEPLNYSAKHVEPAFRDESHRIPYRLNELDVFNTKRQEKLMIAREPVETYSSFTIANETGFNTSYVVYKEESTARTILGFFEQSFWKTLNISRTDAKNACEIIASPLEKVMIPFGIE